MFEALRRLFGKPVPGPTRITQGGMPADKNFARLPFVVWGDVMLNGDRPQTRRALAGADAHECMYTWVYLNELVTVREMLRAAEAADHAVPRSGEELRQRFQALRQATTDPQFQISDELPDVFIPIAAFLQAAGEGNAEFCELGSTFFASIEKLELCARLLGRPLDRDKLRWSGIEYSPFLKRASESFHPGDTLHLATTPAEWKRAREHVAHVSRFVGSYAFRSTAAFADELARSDVFHIIDAFNLGGGNQGGGDFHSWDLGLPITFLSLPTLVDRLAEAGFELHLTRVDPEYHAAGRQKAMVVRLFGIRGATERRLGYFDRFAGLGGFKELFSARRLARGEGETVMREVEASLTADQWEAFAAYKKHFPIWGGPPGYGKDELARLVSSADLGLDLTFDDGQAAHVVRQARQSGSWNP